jgi:plastocyanin
MKDNMLAARTCLIVFTTIAMSALIAIMPAGFRSRAAAVSAPTSQPIAPATSQPVISVRIENFEFEPREISIAVGTTITWQNVDDVPHTASSEDDPQTFDSGALDTDDKFSFTFTKPGKYAYYCKVHPHMTGTITVK